MQGGWPFLHTLSHSSLYHGRYQRCFISFHSLLEFHYPILFHTGSIIRYLWLATYIVYCIHGGCLAIICISQKVYAIGNIIQILITSRFSESC